MKKLIISLSLFLIFALSGIQSPVKAYGNDQNYGIPYTTYTQGQKEPIQVQAAYVPVGILNLNVLLNNPNDLFYKNQWIYIANTGAKNVLILDQKGNLVQKIEHPKFLSPMGIFVDQDLSIFVADKEAQIVFKFDQNFQLVKEYIKPNDPLFGEESVYKPEKVVVDDRGNLYITGEGATNGVIQLNVYGNFLGYFAVNQTSFNWKMILSDFLNLKNQFAKNLPPAPNNLAIDQKGLIYTTTPMQKSAIKKFNLSSNKMFSADLFLEDEKTLDITVDEFYNSYIITDQGHFYVLDQNGNLLFLFGGLDFGDQRLGLIGMPTSIEVDERGNLYVADKNYNNIQIFEKTEFTNLIFSATKSYADGNIKKSKEEWTEVYRINSNFIQANDYLGKISLKEKDYTQAMEYAKFSMNKELYSECFWEVRNQFLVQYSYLIILFIFLLFIGSFFKVFKRLKLFLKKKIKPILKHKLVRELFLIFKIIRRPADVYYSIKKEKKASLLSANILYLLLFVEIILAYFLTSFIFSSKNLDELNFFVEFAVLFGMILLWIVSNYLISTLFNGEGWFKDIYISTAYALAPILILILPCALLTHGLTLNEAFINTFLKGIMYGYSILLLIIMVKEIHNYKVGETIKNLLMTLFTMMIVCALLFVVYLLVSQLIEFIVSIVKEMIIRVSS